jgi:zinc transporter ZupT
VATAQTSRNRSRTALWALVSSGLAALLLALILIYALATGGAGLILAPLVALPVLMFALGGVALAISALSRRTHSRRLATIGLILGIVCAVPPVWLWVWLLAG